MSGATPRRVGASRRGFVAKAALAGLLAAVVGVGARAETIVIEHAEVRTLARAGTLHDATVVIRDGRIDSVGSAAAPAGGRHVDASGQVLTPGIVAAATELGLKEIDGVEETVDAASAQPRYSAALDVVDALNPRSVLIPVNRIEGVTSALSAPEVHGGGSLIAGQAALISLAGALAADDEHFVLRPRAAMVVQLGEGAQGFGGGSRAAALANLREALEEARSGGLRLGGNGREPLLTALDIAALKPVLAGETPLLVRVQRAADIRAALRLADDYGLKLIVSGGAEAHLVARELADHGVPVLLDPTGDLPQHFETLHARPDAAQRLLAAGVSFAFIDSSDFATHNARNLRQLAGIAASYGLPREAALAAITLRPAEILGLAGARGSIEPGKIADLVLWDGDPLEVTSAATQVWIEGRAMPMVSRQTLLRDRYRPAAAAR